MSTYRKLRASAGWRIARWALPLALAAAAIAFVAAGGLRRGVGENVVRTGPIYPELPSGVAGEGVYHHDFRDNEGEWEFRPAPPFDEPYAVHEAGKLTLNGEGSDYGLGSWESPTIGVEPGQLYRAVFRVSAETDIDRDVPQFRLRVSAIEPPEVAYQGVASLVVNSTGTGNFSPTGQAKYYEVYFRTPPDALGIRLEFDLMSFENVEDNALITIGLEEAWVERVGGQD